MNFRKLIKRYLK